MIKVQYIPKNNRIEIEASESSSAWQSIRSMYFDISDDVSMLSPLKISIPPWIFLHHRSRLKYYLQITSVGIEFDESTKKILKKANKTQEDYVKVQNQINN